MIFVFGMLMCIGSVNAATYYSIATGNWTSRNTWSLTSGGSRVGNGVYPVANDIVYIEGGRTVTVDANSACGSLNIANGSSVSVGGFSFVVSGTTSVNGSITFTNTTGTKTMGNVIISGGTWTSNVGESYGISNLTLSGSTINGSNTGIFTVNGNLSVTTGTTNTLNACTISVGGTTTVNGSIIFASNAGTKTFANVIIAGGSWTSNAVETYPTTNLTLSGATINGSSTGAFTVSSNFAVTSGTTNNLYAFNLTVNGTSTIDGVASFLSSTGTKTFIGQTTVSSTGTWDNDNVNAPINFRGGLTNNGTFFAGTSTYTFDTNNQALNGTITIPNTTVNGITLTNNNTLTVTTALSGTGALTNTATGILNIGGTCSITTLTATATGNTVDYNGIGAQTVKATTYSNLILQGSGAKTFPAGTTTVNSLLSLEGTSTATLTGTITYLNSATILQYKGSGIQTTGAEFPDSFGGILLINNSAGVTLNAAKTLGTSSVLTLTNGILNTTTTNLLSITNTASTAISGGSTTSYINGPVKWSLPTITSGTVVTYNFPVGNSTYLPFSLVNPTTSGATTAQIQAFSSNPGGSIDGTLSSKSATEYWSLTTSANFTNSTVSTSRQTAISPSNMIAGCSTINGTYSALGGVVSTNGVSNSNSINSNRFFVFGTGVPAITTSPSSVTGFSYQQNLGPSTIQSLIVSGTALTSNIKLQIKNGNFELSTTTGASFSGSSVLYLPVVSGSVNYTTVYIRQKAGLTQKTLYTDSIIATADGAATKYIICSGTVTAAPTVSVTPASATFSYTFGGSAAKQTFTLNGTNLAGNITVTPPADYEISTDGVTFVSTSISTFTNGSTLHLRLKSGLGVGDHSANIVISSNGASSVNLVCTGTVNSGPTITNSTSFLGSFVYTFGSGPSNPQGFEIKGQNIGTSIVITPVAPVYYAISRTRNGTYQTTAITITKSGNTTDSIYVKLVSGLAVGTYGPSNITVASTGAVTKSVSCTGSVVASGTPAITTSVKSLTGFGYQYKSGTPIGITGGGPSNPQSFVVSATGLSNNISVDAPTNFEVSTTANGTYSSSLSLPSTGAPQTLYVRLMSGKAVGTYSGNISLTSVTGTGTTTATVSCNLAKVYASPLITATGTGDYCVGSTINLTSSGADIGSRYWDGPNSYYSILQSPTLTTNATTSLSGNYIVNGNVVVGGNLIYNGDFELGNVGFGSAYGYPATPFTTSSLVPEGLYAITTTGSVVHNNFNNTPDKNAIGTMQMVVNGNITAGAVVWSQNVAVLQNADYEFSYWLQTVVNGVDGAPSKLQLYVNGVAAGPIYTANPNSGNWTQYLYNTNSGSSTNLNLELVNQTTAAGGNDFSLDSITFKQVLIAKDTATITVNSTLPVSVTIAALPGNTVNSGVPVTFTATPVNEGTTPSYQWYVNNSAVGTNSNTYTYTPANNDQVKCVLTANNPCPTGNPATSSTVVMVVNTVATPNYWIGTTSTDWATASNWTANKVPNVGEDVEFATNANHSNLPAVKDLYVDGNRTIGSLINLSNKRLVIPTGKQLIVNNSITSPSYTGGLDDVDKIYIQSSPSAANGTLIYHNAQGYPVKGTVEMYSKAYIDKTTYPNNHRTWYKWQYFGIPLSSVVASPTFDGSYIREWHEEDPDSVTHWREVADNYVLKPFYGYEIIQPTAKTFLFKGHLVNSDFSTTLQYSSTGLFPGQNILANPYTAAIDVKQLTFGSQTEATVYMYNTGSIDDWTVTGKGSSGNAAINPGQYIAIPQQTAGNLMASQVPSMQSMLIRAMSNSANATFGVTYNSVITKNTDVQRVKAVNSIASSDKVCTMIDVAGTNYADRMWLFSDPSCTHKFDNGWDGVKMIGSTLAPQIFAKEQAGEYQVDAVNDINDLNISFQAGSDVDYELTFTHMNTKRYYPGIYLVDLIENKTIDITETGSTYKFMAESTPSPVDRFKIVTRHYEKDDFVDTSNLKIFSANGMIFVHNFSNMNGDAIIYDISGRKIKQIPFGASGVTALNKGMKPGAYVIKCSTGNENITKRVIVQ